MRTLFRWENYSKSFKWTHCASLALFCIFFPSQIIPWTLDSGHKILMKNDIQYNSKAASRQKFLEWNSITIHENNAMPKFEIKTFVLFGHKWVAICFIQLLNSFTMDDIVYHIVDRSKYRVSSVVYNTNKNFNHVFDKLLWWEKRDARKHNHIYLFNK